MIGGSGADLLDGGTDADSIVGNGGDDELRGGGGSGDTLEGNAGNDLLRGSDDGADNMSGGDGHDRASATPETILSPAAAARIRSRAAQVMTRRMVTPAPI